VTGGLDTGHGRRRGGDRCRLSRRGIGHGRRCCGNSDRGSTRRQRWRNVLQSDSHGELLRFDSPIWAPSRIAPSRTHVVTADTNQCFTASGNPCPLLAASRAGSQVCSRGSSRAAGSRTTAAPMATTGTTLSES
jgi:hypothetical protein